MELKDTIGGMVSQDYRERFIAEYQQTKIRYDDLHKMIIKYLAGTLGFNPVCSLELLEDQASAMGNYLKMIEIRAEVEGIDLNV